MKPMLTGLLARHGPPSGSLAALVDDYVLPISWADLQPTARGGLETETLDAGLRGALARGARVKLRISGGGHAPAWAKRLGGKPFIMIDPRDRSRWSVPRFWTRAYGDAYAELHRLLAARYDSNPVLAEVVISRCTSVYAEPFLRQTSLRFNRNALLKAGYTVAADKACHRQEVVAHEVWSTTRSGLAFNPAQFVQSDGDAAVSDVFTRNMMIFCRATLGRRCVIENMSIRSPMSSLDPNPRRPHYKRMYAAMVKTGPPLAFQTAAPPRLGDCASTLRWAMARNAYFVELPRRPMSASAGCSWSGLSFADARLGR